MCDSSWVHSCCMDDNQFGSARAWLTTFGSLWARNNEGWGGGLCCSYLDLVCMGWILIGRGERGGWVGDIEEGWWSWRGWLASGDNQGFAEKYCYREIVHWR